MDQCIDLSTASRPPELREPRAAEPSFGHGQSTAGAAALWVLAASGGCFGVIQRSGWYFWAYLESHLWCVYTYMAVSWNRATPESTIYSRIFHYKRSTWGYPHLWKCPYLCIYIYSCRRHVYVLLLDAWTWINTRNAKPHKAPAEVVY